MERTMTLTFGLVLCLCALAQLPFSSCANSDPSIIEITKDQVREIGKEVEFNCTVSNLTNNTIIWIKSDSNRSDKTTLSSGLSLIFQGNKFEVKFYNDTADRTIYSLKIKDLKEKDTGFYECQIPITLDNKISKDASLQIRRSPTISLNVTRQVNVTEGDSFSLYCTADGFPMPRISWKREDDNLLSFGGVVHRDNVLTINDSRYDDRGIYICVAENDVGPPDQVNSTVYIKFKPITLAVRPRVGQQKGYQATLECEVTAYPPPMIYWYKNGTEIAKNDFTNKLYQNDKYVGTYEISSVSDESYGDYVCKGVNKLGSTEARMQLYKSVVPICYGSC